MPLTDHKVRTAKPTGRPFKLYDSAGLFLLVSPTGAKTWRFRFKIYGREKLLSFGAYPQVGLSAARKLRNAAIEQVQAGGDPAAERRREKAARAPNLPSFKDLAIEWHAMRQHEWTPSYARQVLNRLETDVFPSLGRKPIAHITPAEMLATLKKVEARGVLETNRRLKQYCSSIFRYAIASQRCQIDPAAPLRDALKSPPRPEHHKALARSEVGDFLIRLDSYDGGTDTRIALRLALLMVPRTTELRAAKWCEFENWRREDDTGLWRIPAERMKMGEQHLVPLSRQSRQLLAQLNELTGHSTYLFPSAGKEGVMCNNTMLYALYRMGYRGKTTTHGFRRLFSTEANENNWNEDWIERQLAHDERNRIRAAYNAAQYLPQRREMMQWWADRLDALRAEEEARRHTHGNVNGVVIQAE